MSGFSINNIPKVSNGLLKVRAKHFALSSVVLLRFARASYGISAKLANSEPFETALHVLEAVGAPRALGRFVVVPTARACFWIAAHANRFGDACTDRIYEHVADGHVDEGAPALGQPVVATAQPIR
jgi:hypothetical protein